MLSTIIHAEQIAIIDYRHFRRSERVLIGIPVWRSFIKLFARSGVNDHFAGRIARQKIPDLLPFLIGRKADPGFYRHLDGRTSENPIQKGFQRSQVTQHTRAFALAGHSTGGAAQIKIHLLISQVPQLPGRPEKLPGILAEYLEIRNVSPWA